MIKKLLEFYQTIRLLRKYILSAVSIALLIILIPDQLNSTPVNHISGDHLVAIGKNDHIQLQKYAQSLVDQGNELLEQGKAAEALDIWKQAQSVYQKLADSEGIIKSQINQSMALQSLGQYRHACVELLTPLHLNYQDHLLCKQPSETDLLSQEKIEVLKKSLWSEKPSLMQLTGLQILGDLLRLIGNLEESQEILNQSLMMAIQLQSPSKISANFLSLGNDERDLYTIQKDLYYRMESSHGRDDTIKRAEGALDYYKKAVQSATGDLPTSQTTLIQAQLNGLSLLLDYQNWLEQETKIDSPDIREKLEQVKAQLQAQVDQLRKEPFLFANLPPIIAIYSRLNFAESLISFSPEKEEYVSIALQYAKDALAKSLVLGNQQVRGYVLGILGSLYEQINDLEQAEDLTKKAVYITQSILAEDIVYKWQYQLGSIYERQGKIPDAIAAYNAAVNTLDVVRHSLLSVNTNVLFYFREKLEPIYRDLINLYLQSPNQENLAKVLEVNKKFQLIELENFIQCNLSGFEPLEKIVKELKQTAVAIIYTIILEKQNKVEVILSLPNQDQPNLYHYSTPWDEVNENVNALRNNLQLPNFRNLNAEEKIMPRYQKLYQLLMAPLKRYLPKQGTLVFVLDSQLQNIPMALLQDENKRYLIEDYSIALSPGSQIRKPSKISWKQSRALIAGLNQSERSSPEFRPLTNVKIELDEVKKNTVSHEILFEKNFTKEKFQSTVHASSFPIIHLATHGKFSSDSEKTFIVAYNGQINVRELDYLLRNKTQGSPEPLELLVLSACETAKGDREGGLGMAGVAVKAGARSTVASIWSVSDRSTAWFMKEFYQRLKAGATKAEALRQAQIAFLKNPHHDLAYQGYEHPYYWAPFILVGNWL